MKVQRHRKIATLSKVLKYFIGQKIELESGFLYLMVHLAFKTL